MIFSLLWLVLVPVSGDVMFKPELLTDDPAGSVVIITIMKVGGKHCGEDMVLPFCSNKADSSEIKNTAAVICRSIMKPKYRTGTAVIKEIPADAATVGYDFDCVGNENNLAQCTKHGHAPCLSEIVVRCDNGLPLCTEECGCKAPSLISKIIGGSDAFPGQFPWQVTLDLDGYMCGGTIIDRQYILTAAHCLHYPAWRKIPCQAQPTSGKKNKKNKEIKECAWIKNDIWVWYNTNVWYENENSGAEKALPDTIYIHPKYVREILSLRHDIAIIKLTKKLELSPYVQPACLPDHWEGFEIPPEAKLTVTGFGDTTASSAEYPDVLQKADIVWKEVTSCNNDEMYGYLSDEHFCAGDLTGKVDACRGDSGGPLLYKNDDDIATVVGIVSFSYGCAVEDFWGVYTDVEKKMDFINGVLHGEIDPNTVRLMCDDNEESNKCTKMEDG